MLRITYDYANGCSPVNTQDNPYIHILYLMTNFTNSISIQHRTMNTNIRESISYVTNSIISFYSDDGLTYVIILLLIKSFLF